MTESAGSRWPRGRWQRGIIPGRRGRVRVVKLFVSRRGGGARDERHVWTGTRASEWAPGNYLRAVAELRRRRPDLVIVSLWRSCIVALMARLVMPRLRLVAFLHLAETVHLPDRLLNRLVMELATEIWADGESTLAARLPARLRHKGRVISFLTERLDRVTRPPAAPRFIFWGRLHPQKGLGRALDIFAAIAAERRDARFTVIGPDMGSATALRAQALRLGVADRVDFTGAMDRAAIFARAAEHTLYLQPSLTEGMAMSVVEAMQLGLIPVVAPVGEIPRYCRDGENALLVTPEMPAGQLAGSTHHGPSGQPRFTAPSKWRGRRTRPGPRARSTATTCWRRVPRAAGAGCPGGRH